MIKTMNHAEYQARLSGLPNAALRFIIKDAQEALEAMPDGLNAGYYADEINYAGMELKNRQQTMEHWDKPVGNQLRLLNAIDRMLRDAGYNSHDTLDNLRDLIKSAQRPATEVQAQGKTFILDQDDVRTPADGYHMDVWEGICLALDLDINETEMEITRAR